MANLTKENRKGLAQWIDDKLPLTGMLEMVDGLAASIILNVVNDKFFSKIPLEYDEDLNNFVAAIYSNDYEVAKVFVVNVLANAIPTPLIDGTPEERAVYEAAFDLVLSLIPKKEVI